MESKKWITFVSTAGSVIAISTMSLRAGQAAPAAPQAAPVSTTFNYQGQLKKSGGGYNGTCNFQFSLWDAVSAGLRAGSTLNANSVSVANGLFAVQLDFGNQFSGDARWLQTAVQCAGDAGMTTLLPRTPLNAAPYAIGLRPGATISTTTANTTALTLNALNANANALAAFGNGNGFSVIYGEDKSATGGYGVMGKSNKGQGVYGVSNTQAGVMGESTSGSGIWGISTNWYGIDGATNSASYAGVRGINLTDSPAGQGVYGVSTNGQGVKGLSTGGEGVYGISQSDAGVYGISASGNGVLGQAASSYVAGVRGNSNSTNGIGVRGEANSAGAVGVWGQSNANTGVYGLSTNGIGVWAQSTNGSAIVGQSTNGYAINALGNATQAPNAGGFAKAMVFVNPFLPAGQQIVRCYNSQLPASQASVPPCGMTVTSPSLGTWFVDFGFNVGDRFASLTMHGSTGGSQTGMEVGQVTSSGISGDTRLQVWITYSYTDKQATNARFTLIVY